MSASITLPVGLKQLLTRLADGQFHSGTALARALNISRSAVWKQLQALDDLGVELLAVSGKGYKLAQPLQLLDAAVITAALSPQSQAHLVELQLHDCIDSTNRQLHRYAEHGAPAGVVCIAEYQSVGKGRRGRQWVSPFGQNILLSVLWRYTDGPAAVNGLSLALGVAVVKALEICGLSGIGLKWPNDIYWQQRKLAGILVEVSGETNGPCFAVMGVGLNIRMSSPQAEHIDQPWVDLSQVLGQSAHGMRNRLMAALLDQLLPVMADYATANSHDWLAAWRAYDCLFGKPVQLTVGECRYDGIAAGIDDQGLLLLQLANGQLRAFASGEVSVRLQCNY